MYVQEQKYYSMGKEPVDLISLHSSSNYET